MQNNTVSQVLAVHVGLCAFMIYLQLFVQEVRGPV